MGPLLRCSPALIRARPPNEARNDAPPVSARTSKYCVSPCTVDSAPPVLGARGKFQRDQGDRIGVASRTPQVETVADTATDFYREERNEEIHQMHAGLVQRALQHLAAPARFRPWREIHQLPHLGENDLAAALRAAASRSTRKIGISRNS